MPGIFISYRQEDSKAWAISLRDELGRVFGEDQVFLDKDTLHAGNWHEQIEQALGACRVVLLVIGPRWLTIVDSKNQPRIQLQDDVHRQEIALALSRNDLTVIPILVDEAAMPSLEELPTDLKALCNQQARKIGDTKERRKADLAVLIKDIYSISGVSLQSTTNTQPITSTPNETKIGWLQFDTKTLASAFALTVMINITAYISGSPIDRSGTLFLLLVFYIVARTLRSLLGRVRKNLGK